MTLPDQNPKTAFGQAKPGLSDVPPLALSLLGQVMRGGAEKYGRYNWRASAVSATVYYDAALRHLFAWIEGEDFDPESGLPHLAHVMACAAILLDADARSMMRDNRLAVGGVEPSAEFEFDFRPISAAPTPVPVEWDEAVVNWEALADQVADIVSWSGESVSAVVDRVAAEYGVSPLRLDFHVGELVVKRADPIDEPEEISSGSGGDEAPLPGAPTDPDPSPAPRPVPVDAGLAVQNSSGPVSMAVVSSDRGGCPLEAPEQNPDGGHDLVADPVAPSAVEFAAEGAPDPRRPMTDADKLAIWAEYQDTGAPTEIARRHGFDPGRVASFLNNVKRGSSKLPVAPEPDPVVEIVQEVAPDPVEASEPVEKIDMPAPIAAPEQPKVGGGLVAGRGSADPAPDGAGQEQLGREPDDEGALGRLGREPVPRAGADARDRQSGACPARGGAGR